MNRVALTSVVCLAVAYGAQAGLAQDTAVIKATKPPAGFVAPKPAEERDVSMARYARESYLDGEEGIVGLRALARQDGSVGETQILTSSGSTRLDQAAQDLVKGWRYVPATLNGAPVDTSVPVQIIWTLETLRFDLTREQAANTGSYYPVDSARRGEQGTSTVRFLTAPDGSVAKVFVDRSSGYRALDEATVTMLRTGWKLAPLSSATGEPTGAWFRASIAWRTGRGTPRATNVCGHRRAPPAKPKFVRVRIF